MTAKGSVRQQPARKAFAPPPRCSLDVRRRGSESAPMNPRYRLARFPRLREIREHELGWEVAELVAKLPDGRPGISSIYRLERGDAIRAPNVRRVFAVVNQALGGTLDAEKEIKRE